jgi:hypothetical protein
MAPEAIAIEKIEGAVANDLIGDVRVTHGDISGLGRLHDGDSLSHRLSRVAGSPAARKMPFGPSRGRTHGLGKSGGR